MNFLDYFFRTTPEIPPHKIFFIIPNMIVITFIFVYYIRDKKYINPKWIAILNLLQQAMLYYWYIFRVPHKFLCQGLPLYHCRIAIITISSAILLNKRPKITLLLAYFGLVGSVVTMFALDIDNYSIIHFSHFSYLLGHHLLIFNALHIIRESKEIFSFKKGVLYTTVMNICIQIANMIIPNANYGELNRMPNVFSFRIEQPYYFIIASGVYILIFVLGRFLHLKFLKFYNQYKKSSVMD